jgi:hypothetical protein
MAGIDQPRLIIDIGVAAARSSLRATWTCSISTVVLVDGTRTPKW